VFEVRADCKAQNSRERLVAQLSPIDAFKFATEGQALVIRCLAPRDFIALERSSATTGEWEEVPLGEEVLPKKQKKEEKKEKKEKKKKTKKGKKEEAEEMDEDSDEEENGGADSNDGEVEIELRIEGNDTKRSSVKDAFLVALAKAKEAEEKGTLPPFPSSASRLSMLL
jgi:hypothetical protein